LSGQYREAAIDLQHAVGLLRQIYTTQLAPYQHPQPPPPPPHQSTISSSSSSGGEAEDRRGVVAAVGRLIDAVALIGDDLKSGRPGPL